MKVENKTIIITGAGSGMGEAMAKLFAKEGGKVIVADINEESVNKVVTDIQNEGGEAAGVIANIGKQEDIDKMMELAKEKYGSLDVLINNAGIMDNFTPAGDLSDDLWNRVIDINLTGPFKAARAAINIMEEQENGGVIINNASVGGLFGTRGGAAYIASKHGLIGLTKNIAATYGAFGKVRANAIAPGGINTNIQKTITEPHELGLKALQAAGSGPLADPIQVAQVALFLASDDSSFVNGDVIKADGGWTAR